MPSADREPCECACGCLATAHEGPTCPFCLLGAHTEPRWRPRTRRDAA